MEWDKRRATRIKQGTHYWRSNTYGGARISVLVSSVRHGNVYFRLSGSTLRSKMTVEDFLAREAWRPEVRSEADERAKLVGDYRDDSRWEGSLDRLREYVDRTPLTRREAGFYRRLVSAWTELEEGN